MKKGKKGFVVSAVLYPLLVLFLAIIMGLLSMTDTRKRILDKMKLEITDNIFDDAACSCDTILAKLNYIIANGTGGSGGDTGSYAYNKLTLNVKTYEAYSDFPVVGNIIGDIAVLSDTPIKNYYVSTSVPKSPQEGTVWIVQDNTSNYYVTSDWNRIGISYVMQYENSKWVLKKAYVYNGESWTMLYYVNLKNGYVDITGTDINAETTKTYDYTGEYQTFKAVFSGYYKIELWGAQGWNSNLGGKGAYTKGEIYLNAGEQLYIYVGSTGTSTQGGWNGGGRAYTSQPAGGGGGATDVRLVATTEKNIWNEFESLKSRIMVAAGGGGYNGYSSNSYGGAGGGLTGYNGGFSGSNSQYVAQGATQSEGGLFATNGGIHGNSGIFGSGGDGNSSQNHGAGGGGGYYGGGGGTNYKDSVSSGSGGASYISGHAGCNSISELSSSVDMIIHTGDRYHYSGYYFENTQMVDGKGYSWSEKKANQTNMPTHNGISTMVGNTENGYAKITLETVEVKDKSYLNEKKEYIYKFTSAFNYSIFTVPKTGQYNIELNGAQGGNSNLGGNGGRVTGKIFLEKGMTLYVYVGSTPKDYAYMKGGWNGGGTAGTGQVAGGGGGATDIRLINATLPNNFESLKSRIMVAAGGGGYNGYLSNSYGGSGGNLIGGNGTYSGSNSQTPPTGGTQTYGGIGGGTNSTYGIDGEFGIGANYNSSNNHGGGGGGGYYGGGSGSNYKDSVSSGSGGSSYISGYEGCSSIEKESTPTNIIHNGSAYHYSGYYFTDPVMSDGINSGDGSARIEYISENNTIEEKNYVNNYSYSGTSQKFTALKTGIYKIELWGAQGWNSNLGGKGAYTSGEIKLVKDTTIYVYVGQMPNHKSYMTGGWNGGGTAGTGQVAGGGGGATDIRLVSGVLNTSWNDEKSLKSRIMVAAGGGGFNGYLSNSYGGSAGGLNGYDGSRSGTSSHTVSTGGKQNVGGEAAHYSTSYHGNNGTFGYGGNANLSYNHGGGGGSGWYGGGGGTNYSDSVSSGAGGSSYISGHEGCIGIDSGGTPLTKAYSKLIDSISYTNYSFNNTVIVDGKGYSWSTVISSSSTGMPSPTSSSLITGNTGSGYARITYLGS